MSCSEPPVSGRVNAIKNQFENLKSLDFIDANVPKKKLVKKPGFFQRSKTTHDLLAKISNKSAVNESHKNFANKVSKKSTCLTTSKPDNDKSSDSEPFLVKSKFAKIVEETKEPRLSRQTSDPIKRSSIKRSPAFRISSNTTNINANPVNKKEKSGKALEMLQKTSSSSSPPKEFNTKKFEYFLVRKCASEIEKLQQPCLTDSIRYALKQPLPTGPPPKKPPRLFAYTSDETGEDDSPVKNINPIDSFKVDKKCEQSNSQSNENDVNNEAKVEMRNKIQVLENKFFAKNNNKKNEITNTNNNKKPIALTKSKTELVLQGSKLLDCISCRKSVSYVYDPFVQTDNIETDHHQNPNMSAYVKRFANSVMPVEPIYMEPFSHLKNGSNGIFKKNDNKAETASTSGESMNEHSISESICSCPEIHHNLKEDLHYLCSPIEDNMDDTSLSCEKDQKLTLGKTYNEITILVDAAFQNKANKSTESLHKENSDGRNSAVRLSRTLTEKRKDYVRRIAVIPDNQIKNYGTLHRTFKSPVIKTFSLEENDKNLNNSNKISESNRMKTNSGILSLSDRLDNYKKLINNNTNSSDMSTPSSAILLRQKQSTDLIDAENDTHMNRKTLTLSLDNNTQLNNKTNNILNKNTNNKEKNDINFNNENDIDEIDATNETDLLIEQESNSFVETISKENLFEVFILVGYNSNEKQAYLKYKFPQHVQIPDNIEQLIFPSENLIDTDKTNQEYCLILTDDNGYKIYGYCRRILPENCDTCLPLCYCIISETKALGFYQKLLKEIESRHGQTDIQMNFLLKSLQNSKLPVAGKYLHVKLPLSIRPKTVFSSHHKISPKRLSLEANPKWLTESAKASTLSKLPENNDHHKASRKNSQGQKSLLEEYEEKKAHNNFDYGIFNRSLIMRDPKFDEILIRRPNDLRLESTELSELFVNLGPELLVIVFSTLLLERKVILESENITILSKSILALQTILYPFQWQYTIVTILPQNLTEICQAPFPILVGTLEAISFEIEDGIVVNLDKKSIKQSCGDEQTILPDSLRESLQMSLEMVDLIDQGKMLSAVLISEAFLRFFVELFGNYRQKYFHKEEFIQCHTSQNVKFFLEWFVETSMFRHFCNHKFDDTANDNELSSMCQSKSDNNKEDKFYDLFEARLMEKSENKTKTKQNIESIVKNSKIINNKKGKSFKDRFKHLIGHHNHN